MRWLNLVLVVIALCASSNAVNAQEASSRTLAREEFQRGLALARSGDLDAAARSFEAAYRASPHHAVLYNLGQAYSGLGKPVEAVRTLEQFLRDGAGRIEPARRREVEALLERERGRIGYLEIAVTPKDAELLIDGKISDPALSGARSLSAGRHFVAARKPGYTVRFESVEVQAKDTTRISLTLEEEAVGPHGATPGVGQLAIACDLPAVEISVDGVPRGRTPLEVPLLAPIGTRTVHFTRPGYRSVERALVLSATKPARLACPMTVDLRGIKPGRLTVTPSERFARVSVDGFVYDGAPLPPGPHAVRVDRTGFRRWARVVSVASGGTANIAAILEPTPDHLAELEALERRQNHFAIGIGATGVALLGTSVALFVWNNGRYEDWRANSDSSNSAARAAELQRTDDIAIGAAVLGGAALISAGVLFLTNTGSESYAASSR